ncbi:hypothetical protein NL492_27600, partial [Klebsiella pneumoniae]|nr:hypothetical protein [Klebsiella pneumoniae]
MFSNECIELNKRFNINGNYGKYDVFTYALKNINQFILCEENAKPVVILYFNHMKLNANVNENTQHVDDW